MVYLQLCKTTDLHKISKGIGGHRESCESIPKRIDFDALRIKRHFCEQIQ